jgi:glycosyltransferase involved in cell wall biosynthesis
VPAPERIAIVTTSYPAHAQDPCGHFVATEARDLTRAGHQVTVFTGATRSAAGESGDNPRVVRLWDGGASGWPGLLARLKQQPTRSLGLFGWGLAVRRELARRGPFQRVIGHWLLPTGFPVLFAADFSGAALELVVHGSDARLIARLPRALGRALLRALCRNARLRCVSHDLLRLLQEIAGQRLQGQVFVEALPIDTSAAPTRARARAELGVPENARLIVVVARLVSSKRVPLALAAAALLSDVLVVVVGDGPERGRLARAGVRFVGRVDRERALAFIAAADVLLSASRLEGAPSAVREARALAVPVVSSTAGDLSRWAELDPELWIVP